MMRSRSAIAARDHRSLIQNRLLVLRQYFSNYPKISRNLKVVRDFRVLEHARYSTRLTAGTEDRVVSVLSSYSSTRKQKIIWFTTRPRLAP